MKFNLLINPIHSWQDSNDHALILVQSMINHGHQINAVFFYGESSQIAAKPDFQISWKKLIQQQTFDLLICRTMIEYHEIKPQLEPEFKIVGMGHLTLAMEQSDRTVELV
ncbi:DsrE family protein [Marinicella litoralis]|uniref:Sulfur relay (Sulfurtransferase) complex TusBCD TusD component (DsrE family) n=1 Tax=Marinicella litoralis TaxID=644220 RepID=A0A4R6XWG1_9GAMM|nr:DsrE family protein [Marinicella litoralis]TDR22780.1 sulfur relay (sulfurtransferase) complex TusBCD TusD component (DsrE family) [Marinicella litoralis]